MKFLIVITLISTFLLGCTQDDTNNITKDDFQNELKTENTANNTILDENIEQANISWQENVFFAVSFLGYSDSDTFSTDGILEKYFTTPQLENIYSFDGDEIYLIIPKNIDEKIYIYEELIVDDNFKRGELLTEIQGENHFFIKCNVSDLFSNISIETNNDGIIFNFAPRISLENGKLAELYGILSLENY